MELDLKDFLKNFLNRFFDVGIAEQHAVLWQQEWQSQGLRPVFAVYSTFLTKSI